MLRFLEPLEVRMFLSAAPQVVTIHADEAVAKSAIAAIKKDAAGTVRTITMDLKVSHLLKSDRPQVTALSSGLATLEKGDTRAINSATAIVNKDVGRLLAAVSALSKKPSNSKLLAAVSDDRTALGSAAAAKLLAFNTANQGAPVVADLNTVDLDGGAAGSAASAAITKLSNDGSTLSTDAMKAFSTDVVGIQAL